MTHESSQTRAVESARKNENSETSPTRYAFVEMLFALAIAEVAVIASHVVRVSGPWTEKLPVTAHLTLGAILIATSWLGWSASLQRRREERAEHPFSWDFLGLLMDVLLVVFYFILVRQAEITEEAPYRLTPPSGVPEATWLLVIFATYAAWDFVTDVFKRARPRPPLGFRRALFRKCCMFARMYCFGRLRLAARVLREFGVVCCMPRWRPAIARSAVPCN